MYYKLHKIDGELILAVADREVLAKKYESNNMVLDLEKFSSFYMGELTDSLKLSSLLSNCTIANIVGKKACSIAISNNYAKSQNVVVIGGVPHLQLYKIDENINL